MELLAQACPTLPDAPCACPRCTAVVRFFQRLKMPNCGIDFTDEPEDFTQLLVNAAAFGCSKPKPLPKIVPRKMAIPTSKVSRETCAAITQACADKVVEADILDEGPPLQLEASEMEIENMKPALEKNMVDAATSYYIPKTPLIPGGTKVSVGVGETAKKPRMAVDAECQTSDKSLMAFGAAAHLNETGSLAMPSPVLSMARHRQSAGVQAFANSPILTYLARRSGAMKAPESPLIRRISVIPPPTQFEPETYQNSLVRNPPKSPVPLAPNNIGNTLSDASSPSIVSMIRYGPSEVANSQPGKTRSKPARSREVRLSEQGSNPTAGIFAVPKYVPCIFLPSPSGKSHRRSTRVKVFGNCGIVRHPESNNVVGVLACARSELLRIQEAARPLMPENQTKTKEDLLSQGNEVNRALNTELADGSGRIILSPTKTNSRFFGLFILSSAGRPLRHLQSGYFKFTIIQLKAEHLTLTLRDATFNFSLGAQFALQPGDEYAMAIHPNKKNNEAILAFEYMISPNFESQ